MTPLIAVILLSLVAIFGAIAALPLVPPGLMADVCGPGEPPPRAWPRPGHRAA